MNLPNKLTVIRIILVPFFVAALLNPGLPGRYLIAELIFIAASLTDHYDGKIARERNQITNFGKFLDPLADKILVISALVCFLELGLANVWCVLLIIAREFMVTSIRLVAMDSGKVIAANKWGKFKTVSQIVAVIAVLAVQYVGGLVLGTAAFAVAGMQSGEAVLLFDNVMIWIATFFTVFSGVVYIRENIHLIDTTK